MGTRMMGLAPRPPFSQANCGLGPTSGRYRFSLKDFSFSFAQAISGLGPACWALSFIFSFWCFCFPFCFPFSQCQHPGYPVYDMRISWNIVLNLNFVRSGTPYSAKSSLWGIVQKYSFGSERLCGNGPLLQSGIGGKARGDYFCKGVPLACHMEWKSSMR